MGTSDPKIKNTVIKLLTTAFMTVTKASLASGKSKVKLKSNGETCDVGNNSLKFFGHNML